MRLYLALAVLMLALATCTEAQEEETIEQKLVKFGEKVAAMGRKAAESAKVMGRKAAESAKEKLQRLRNSEFTARTRNWLQERFDAVSQKLRDVTN